jgi:hypothetical protein
LRRWARATVGGVLGAFLVAGAGAPRPLPKLKVLVRSALLRGDHAVELRNMRLGKTSHFLVSIFKLLLDRILAEAGKAKR